MPPPMTFADDDGRRVERTETAFEGREWLFGVVTGSGAAG